MGRLGGGGEGGVARVHSRDVALLTHTELRRCVKVEVDALGSCS